LWASISITIGMASMPDNVVPKVLDKAIMTQCTEPGQ